MSSDTPIVRRDDAPFQGGALWALEATTDNVILIDREFRITFINRATAALNGITQESVLGRTIWEQWPGNLGTDIERNYRHAMATGEPVRFVHGYFEKGRFDLWLEIHAYPSPDGLAIFFHDISDAKRQADDQERLARAIQATDLGVWRVNLPFDGTPFYLSPQVRRHMGITDDESIAMEQFVALLHPDDVQATAEGIARAIAEGIPYDVVYRTIGRDGKTRWVRASGNAFYREDGTPYQFDGYTLDYTERIETERELRETQRRVEATLAAAEIGTFLYDPATASIHADANVAAMFGMSSEEADRSAAEGFVALIHPDQREEVGRAFAFAASNGLPFAAEYRISEGEPVRWVLARGYPERDEAGDMVRMPGVILDITAQKEAQAAERSALETVRASERRQRLRIELVDALRGQTDAATISTISSEVVGRFFGARRAYYVDVDPRHESFEVLQGWQDNVPLLVGVFSYDDFGRGLIKEIARGATVAIEDTESHPLTRDRYAHAFGPAQLRSFLVVPRLRDGQLLGMFALNDRVPRQWSDEERTLLEDLADRVWDAIERARAVADLEALNAKLDEIVRWRTAELLRANEESEAFNYSIAHDLRSPLRAMNATSGILLEELGGEIDPEHRALLERQAHNAKRLGQLIDALLGLSRLARRAVQRSEIDLSALAREAAQSVEAASPGGCTMIEVADGLGAHADPGLVRLVLQNLLENACKFSPHGGTVRVGGSDGTFWVRDQGVGFDMAFAPKIFLPFERLVSEQEFPGTGIGLANVERIVKRHGGRVWAESAPGKGATFFFTLEPPKEGDRESTAHTVPLAKTPSILASVNPIVSTLSRGCRGHRVPSPQGIQVCSHCR